MDKVLSHVKLHYVVPEDERDFWNGMDEETKASWTPIDGYQAEVGEPTEFLALLSPPVMDVAMDCRNVEYIVEAQTAFKQGYVVEELTEKNSGTLPVPSDETMKYMNSTIPDEAPGVVYFLLDTGGNVDVIKSMLGTSKIMGTQNFVSGGTDVTDVDGHGTMCASLLVPRDGAELYIFKVLGDNGSGGSGGIVSAIREAAKIAKRDPAKKYILSGSLGSAPNGRKFQPYVDACTLAESVGVLCRWSAGNDGVRGVGSPGNWRTERASIAFNRKDQRASFSNHETWAGFSSEGEGIRVRTNQGNLASANGTSFSLPVSNREIGKLAAYLKISVFDADALVRATCRKTPEPLEEESAGLIDVGAAVAKQAPGSPAPAPTPAPGPSPTPNVPEFSKKNGFCEKKVADMPKEFYLSVNGLRTYHVKKV